MTRSIALALAALGLALAGPVGDVAPARAEDPPRRVVIAGGALTEIAFALGAGDRVVGVDATSSYPPEATERPDIGYFRRLSAEGVLSLNPDLLLAAPETGPEVALDQIGSAGVEIRTAPDIGGAEGIAPRIRFVGKALAKEQAADRLAQRVTSELETIRAKVAKLETRPRVLFIMLLRGGAPVVGGQGTEAHAILELAGGRNAAAGLTGYKPMTREAILGAQPDVVVMMESRAKAAGGIDKVLDRPDLKLTPAGKAGRGVTLPGMLMLGFGPRTPEAVARLAKALHPDASIAAAGL